MQAQLDADIIPADALGLDAAVQEGKLKINGEEYGCLVLPWAERWPRAVLQTIARFLEQGLKVACVKDWPLGASEGGDVSGLLSAIRRHPGARLATLEDLPAVLRAWGMDGVRTANAQPYLRRYRYEHPGMTVWMFFNEDPAKTVETSVWLDGARNAVAYDPFANRLTAVSGRAEDDGLRVPLVLAPEESIILLAGDVPQAPSAPRWSDARRAIPLSATPWRVATADAEAYPQFTPWRTLEAPVNLCQPDMLPDFSGTIAYETTFTAEVPNGGAVFLDLGEVGEVAEAWINGTRLGLRMNRPYVFDVTGGLRAGENTLRVEVTNTLVCAMKDFFSRFAPQGPSGLVGPVTLRYVR
jgi:hypothetical protein